LHLTYLATRLREGRGQVGLLAALECYFLQNYFSDKNFSNWGWRISFMIGGLIGLLGFILRYRLHETKLFQEMVSHHKMAQESVWNIFREYWKGIIRGISFGTAQTVSFHFISVLFPILFFHLSGISDHQSLVATLVLLIITTIPLPIYGLLAEKYDVKYLAIAACLLMISLLYPLYISIRFFSPWNALLMMGLFSIILTCLTALWPYFISHLFPTRVRYTCVGLSFNISDGCIGGLSTLFILYFFNIKKDLISFIWIALAGCIISILSCVKLKSSKGENSKKS
jgi:MFS transporter, MHS family, proline/betaine transporter